MRFAIIFYDEYYDIPLRGVLQTESTILAFDARVLEEEPTEIESRPGVYSRLRAFECDDSLKLVLEEKKAIFSTWRKDFDEGLVPTSTHPLYADTNYQRLRTRANELFGRLKSPILEVRGLMHVESGKWVFDEVSRDR